MAMEHDPISPKTCSRREPDADFLRHPPPNGGRVRTCTNRSISVSSTAIQRHEPAESQKATADQVDCRQTLGETKALFGQPGDRA